jgi:hypothetical protein
MKEGLLIKWQFNKIKIPNFEIIEDGTPMEEEIQQLSQLGFLPALLSGCLSKHEAPIICCIQIPLKKYILLISKV